MIFFLVITVDDRGRPTTTTLTPMLTDLISSNHPDSTGTDITDNATKPMGDIVSPTFISSTKILCSSDSDQCSGHQMAVLMVAAVVFPGGLANVDGTVVAAVGIVIVGGTWAAVMVTAVMVVVHMVVVGTMTD